MTKTSATLAAAALALCALSAGAARAQADDDYNLFISPAGQPFTAPLKDPYPIVLWFNGADKNKDGKLDKLEHRADAEAFFKVLDRNKDGYIDSFEVAVYEHYLVPEILTAGPSAQLGLLQRVSLQEDSGEGSASEPTTPRQRLNTNQGAVQFSLLKEPEPVRAADRNLDYRVSLQEFRDHADRHFGQLDLNGDGFLTLDELPQTPAERQAKARRTPR